jgi:hypothetical protein
MSDTEQLGLELTGVFVHDTRGVMVTAETEDGARKGIDHTNVYWHNDGRWFSVAQWPNAIVGSTFLPLSPLERFFLTANGKVYRRIKSSITEEMIDASDDGPSDLLLMQSVIDVRGELFAVGMARRAYRRTGPDQWRAIDQTCVVPRADRKEAVGFTDLAGDRPDNIVAVGYKGEIWRYDGERWHQDASPTDVTLTAVAQASPTEFTVCGLRGTVIVGGPGHWSVVAQNVTKADFWGAAHFNGRSFVSNHDGVFALDGGGLRRCYPQTGEKDRTAYLSAGSTSIWSVGQRHVAWSADGVDWTEVESP